MRPGPTSDGAPRDAGAVRTGVAVTVTRKAREAEPPEFVAVTVTVSPARGVLTGMERIPVAGSIVAPAPVTPKTSAAPEKACAVGRDAVAPP